jgi:trehalose synthase
LLAANIDEYSRIVGRPVIDELYMLASRLQGKVVQNINSTAVGGGVAEILVRMIPLLKQIGVDARWDVIKGNERFFTITKNIHNALHQEHRIVGGEVALFLDVNRLNAAELYCGGHYIHSRSQPVPGRQKAEVGKVDLEMPYRSGELTRRS